MFFYVVPIHFGATTCVASFFDKLRHHALLRRMPEHNMRVVTEAECFERSQLRCGLC